ncbi:uncharacterized protein PV07_12528 [Cladophialophora immunda]|uniref:Uncharacterized protein n=1 Tax=Cladophialophora immunda TaxID=569365 RepID=A0A0D2BUJ6_9EURO|nr:uncharacterized protein PV07_12528 [Cladophialophora immunda]KIW22065.1 hypothetical protein PV07_12528 [Cladophialophora immunda]
MKLDYTFPQSPLTEEVVDEFCAIATPLPTPTKKPTMSPCNDAEDGWEMINESSIQGISEADKSGQGDDITSRAAGRAEEYTGEDESTLGRKDHEGSIASNTLDIVKRDLNDMAKPNCEATCVLESNDGEMGNESQAQNKRMTFQNIITQSGDLLIDVQTETGPKKFHGKVELASFMEHAEDTADLIKPDDDLSLASNVPNIVQPESNGIGQSDRGTTCPTKTSHTETKDRAEPNKRVTVENTIGRSGTTNVETEGGCVQFQGKQWELLPLADTDKPATKSGSGFNSVRQISRQDHRLPTRPTPNRDTDRDAWPSDHASSDRLRNIPASQSTRMINEDEERATLPLKTRTDANTKDDGTFALQHAHRRSRATSSGTQESSGSDRTTIAGYFPPHSNIFVSGSNGSKQIVASRHPMYAHLSAGKNTFQFVGNTDTLLAYLGKRDEGQ